jgi:4-hydroxy-tetrahydrodipicolinate reductase
MKIALLGYGRMGKAIENIAIERGHTIVLKVDVDTKEYDISTADIAIDFSIPSSAFENITNCFKYNVPVVSGTTGWLEKYNHAIAICNENNSGFISATNFSLGVNIFFELNEQLAKMMANLNEYSISMEEIHHTKKLDAPSGTAITLAEGVIKNTKKINWALDVTNDSNEIPIVAKRIPDVPGTHSVSYASAIDDIEIKHTAHNRKGFALGAVVAAEWLVGKTGIFSMKDVLGL